MDRQLIETYAADAETLGKSIAGLLLEDLLAHPVPGTWSIQQIVLHMVDSDLILADRMKRIIAEDKPLLMGFDEAKFAARLHYDAVDPHLACDIFAKNRQWMAAILRRLSDEDFQRAGIHSERGLITLADFVGIATKHLHHHLKFLREKRKLLGKPL
jgi:uncharacterized damage-inducible protein DinB